MWVYPFESSGTVIDLGALEADVSGDRIWDIVALSANGTLICLSGDGAPLNAAHHWELFD